MVDETLEPLSAAELADIDAQYKPFPAFADWPSTIPREDLWIRDFERFQEVSAHAAAEDLQKAQQIALRTAAFDTGAIEGLYPTDRGLTFTVATQASAWEQIVEEKDTNALALFKAQLAAFELVLDLATDHFPKITQTWIRRLHEEVTAAQSVYPVRTPAGVQEQPLPKGEYKRFPNHVKTADGQAHAYAPVELTQAEMQRLMDELDTAEFRGAHPILQASYTHYAIAAIHPFADGNGRVARAVASAYTYRAASIPLLVLAHHRDQYFSALSAADSGDARAFLEFIARVARDGLEMITESLIAAQSPQPDRVLAEFRELYLAQGDLSHQQLDQLANEFVELLLGSISQQVESLTMPDGVDIRWVGASGGGTGPLPEGFRAVVTPGARSVHVDFKAAAPGSAALQANLDVFVSTKSDTAATLVVRVRESGDQLTLGLADLNPQISSAARFRVESFVHRFIGNYLNQLLSRSKKRLRKLGY